MCGRYTIISTQEEIENEFGIETQPYTPQYNAAPSLQLPVITDTSPNRLSFLRWGLIPYWAKDISFGNKTMYIL